MLFSHLKLIFFKYDTIQVKCDNIVASHICKKYNNDLNQEYHESLDSTQYQDKLLLLLYV